MSIKKRDQKILLYIIGVLLFVAVYFLYFSNKRTEIAELETEVEGLQEQIRELEDYELNEARYKKETKEYYDEIEDIAEQFPADIKEETVIMYGRNLETEVGVSVTNMSMSVPTLLNSFGVGERQKYLYGTAVTINFSGDYDMTKRIVEHIQMNEDKRNITTLNLSYSPESGGLTGTATLNLYSMTGKDQIYTEPDTGDVQHGTTNIFTGQ